MEIFIFIAGIIEEILGIILIYKNSLPLGVMLINYGAYNMGKIVGKLEGE